jgi:PAS domain S-box-containing protein
MAAVGSDVRSFLRRFHNEILAAWRRLARELPAARQMSTVSLTDHVPEMLDQIAELADVLVHEGHPEPLAMARRHAIDRLQAGFDITAVVSELSMLRACVLDVWARENPEGSTAELRALDLAIDQAVSASVTRYAEVRERTLAGIDQISMAALESRSLEDLLGRLLEVFVSTSPSVDTAAILLREGDRFHLRAAVGLQEELDKGFSVALGEGFAGRIAQDRAPMTLRSAYLDPTIVSDVIRRRRVRALHGVPLVHADRVIGVAHMGSMVADDFSHDDRQVFASLAARATIGIVHQLLRREMAESETRFRQIASERERALSKLEALLAASPLGIAFVDRDLRYLRINEAMATLNGRPAGEHIGRRVREILPEYADLLEPLLLNVLATGDAVTNMEAAGPEGRHLLLNFFPVRSAGGDITGIGGIILDVTDAKVAQEALRAEQVRLQSILEYAPAAIWIKDAGGRIVVANQKLAESLRHSLADTIGHRSEELLPEAEAAQHVSHDEIVRRERRPIEVEETVATPDGARTFLSIKFPIPSDPPLIGGIATEITERKRIEDELRASVRAREDLLAIVSHDLRNPLGAIQLSASMLQGAQNLDARGRRHVELIHRSALRMETLIDDLLDTANIRARRLALELKPEPADTVLAEAVELQQSIATENGVSLVRRDNVDGTLVTCDRNRVLQVFGNLIGNALKFCRAGDTVSVSASREGDMVRFAVGDTGPGIAPDLIPHLFEAYWSGAQDKKQGAGLGLYISRGIVEGHGGRMWVESTPGTGSTFYFTLPVSR